VKYVFCLDTNGKDYKRKEQEKAQQKGKKAKQMIDLCREWIKFFKETTSEL
jgi:hypothetical protein